MSSEGILMRVLINLLNQCFSFWQVFLQQLFLLRLLSSCLLVTWSLVCVCVWSLLHCKQQAFDSLPWKDLTSYMNFNGAAALSLRAFKGIFRLPSEATFAKLLSIHVTQGVEQHAKVPIVWFVFPTSVPHSATQISHLICIRTKGNGDVPAGTYLMGDTSCSPRFPAVVRRAIFIQPCPRESLPPGSLRRRLGLFKCQFRFFAHYHNCASLFCQ